MTKTPILSFAALIAASAFVGCNGDATDYTESSGSNVAVYSFNLQENDKILKDLDTVYFSIDLGNARIFNADSLPYGTRVDALIPSIKVVEGASAMTLEMSREGKPDTIIDYINYPEDSIDFSNGPVKLKVVSLNELVSRTYEIKVNVHQVKSDSLQWANTAYRALPSMLQAPTRQKTTANKKAYYCLTTDGSAWSLAKADEPSGEWTYSTPQLPLSADINTFCVSETKFFIIDNGMLLSSTDAIEWTSTGRQFDYIYGTYGERVLGVFKDGSVTKFAEYPGDKSIYIPYGLPVKGTSPLTYIDFDMSMSEMALLIGGEQTDGTLNSKVWAYDGNEWACLTKKSIAKDLKDMTMIPFYTFKQENILTVKKFVSMFAFGGTDGIKLNRTLYTSVDYGIKWNVGGQLLQLPDFIPSFYGAQAFVAESTLSVSRNSIWNEYVSSRATAPITEWDCPYIYIFGGYDKDGNLNRSIWRGTINRLSFKPLQ